MAKQPNPLPPVEVTLSINSQTAWYLDRLIETGLFGNTRPQAAAVVIYDHCKLLIANGELSRVPAMKPVTAIDR